MTPAAIHLLDLLKDGLKVVKKASNGRWYVTGKSGQVKASAVQELLSAGRLLSCSDYRELYRRKP